MFNLIRFNHSSKSFIGVAFPIRLLGFVSCEVDCGSLIFGSYVFRSVSLDLFCTLQEQDNYRLSNLPYSFNWDSELNYFKSLDRASKDIVYAHSVYDRLGRICFGFDPFGTYVATNLRNVTSDVSLKKVINRVLFPLHQLEFLKDSPTSIRFPITYKYNPVDCCHTVVEGIHESCDSSEPNGSWVSHVYIEIGFQNPKDIMIHSSYNQFKHWSDVLLSRLGIDLYRFVHQYMQHYI